MKSVNFLPSIVELGAGAGLEGIARVEIDDVERFFAGRWVT